MVDLRDPENDDNHQSVYCYTLVYFIISRLNSVLNNPELDENISIFFFTFFDLRHE